MAGFILEFPLQFEGDDKALMSPHALDEIKQIKENDAPWWTLYIDGAANNEGAGAGVVLMSPEGHKLSSAIHFSFKATNNDTEYEALINSLQLALEMKVENLNVFSDSSLVVFQVNGGFQTRGPRTELYYKFPCAGSSKSLRKFLLSKYHGQIMQGQML